MGRNGCGRRCSPGYQTCCRLCLDSGGFKHERACEKTRRREGHRLTVCVNGCGRSCPDGLMTCCQACCRSGGAAHESTCKETHHSHCTKTWHWRVPRAALDVVSSESDAPALVSTPVSSGKRSCQAVSLQPKVLSDPPRELPSTSFDVVDRSLGLNYHRLAERLQERGLQVRLVRGDGNCLFRALADQLYGSENHHGALRAQVVDQLKASQEHYSVVIPGRFDAYLAEMAQDGSWGDHVTLQAAADAFGKRIHLLTDHETQGFIKVFPRVQNSQKVLRLSFSSDLHYDSIV